jgi:DNA-binding CsgD family transcriptional regulator
MSRTFLGFFLWIELLNVALRLRQSSVFLFGVFFIPTDCFSGILTNYLIPQFSIRTDGLPWEFTGAFALAMALILLLGSFVYLSSLAFKLDGSPEEPGNHDENTRRKVCVHIADEYKLTARESEVLFCISQGHSIKRTAETLYISVSTAQTHIKALYRKLELHSRQEVIDLVTERLALK